MRRFRRLLLPGLVLLGALPACRKEAPTELLGSLEWDRIGVPAEVSEPVLELAVAEGAPVQAGQVLLRLDPRRGDARLAQAQANVAQQRARLDEALHGARSEQMDALRAGVASAQATLAEAQKQYARYAELGRTQVVARATVDNARATRDRAAAQVAQAQAQLRELTSGTRPEQVAQAEAALQGAQSARDALKLDRERLLVRAPRAGRVDALPFKAGDQPPPGAIVASLLVGDAPYARVFVPASLRVQVREGQEYRLHVEGSTREWHARVRHVARDPSFTPYYALTGDDASRLVYRAEFVLTDAEAKSLPAGVPVQVRLAR
jgi:HlyD family secretion protein